MENVPLSRAEQLAEWQRARGKLKDQKEATKPSTWRASSKDQVLSANLVPRNALSDMTNARAAPTRGEKRAVRVPCPDAKKTKPRAVTQPARRKAPAPAAPKTPRAAKPRARFASSSSIPPEKAARLRGLAKTRPEARTELWKTKVEEIMAEDNLHGSAAFWLVRSQYAELVLSKQKPEHVKAMVTPVLLGLDGQAQPAKPLMERAQSLIQQLFSKYKQTKGSQQMAGSLQHSLRKAWRPEQANVARTPGRTPRRARTPSAAAENFLILDASSPDDGSIDGSLEDLYDTADWTAPDDVSPQVVAEFRTLLEAAVEERNPQKLAQAIHRAEEHNILFPQVDEAKRVLVETMIASRETAGDFEVYEDVSDAGDEVM